MTPPDDITQYEFFKKLTLLPYIEAIYLYGSRVWKEGSQDSDIDMAILCPDATDEEWQQVGQIVEGADTILHIDVERFDTLPNANFKRSIEKSMVPVYVRPWHFEKPIFEDMFGLVTYSVKTIREWLAKNTISEEMLCEEYRRFFLRFCKLARKALKIHGVHAHSPRSSLSEAFHQRWIADRQLWEHMLQLATQVPYGATAEIKADVRANMGRYTDAIDSAARTIHKDITQVFHA